MFSIATVAACNSRIFAQEVKLTPPSTAITGNLFGMHIQRAVSGTVWPPIPFAKWRLWDSGAYWPNLEPTQGQWNFDSLDKFVSLAQQHQVELMLTLGATPTWASTRPNEPTPYVSGSAAEPSNIKYWRDFVTKVATRYKGQIKFYEIWNEPNLQQFYSGTVDNMLLLAHEAYSILKKVDPSITVVSPSATGNDNGPSWLEEYLRKGGGAYADVIGYHFYVVPNPPEAIVPLVRKVQRIMLDHGISNKPLWNTEIGWVIANSHSSVDPKQVGFSSYTKVLTQDEAAAYVARSFILGWATGLERFYWYAWDSREMGLSEADGKNIKRAAIAYNQVQKWLVGSRMTVCDANTEKTWTCQLTRDGGYTAWIVWNPDRKLSFKVPKNWSVQQVRNLTGVKRNLPKLTDLEIGPSPLLLEPAG